ncbi:MAG: hypothetical protein GY765_07845, partial [bacterium]|nr:hypothetical protein [bacterium]
MKFFCVPSDFKKESIDFYHRLNGEAADSAVHETYGNVTVAGGNESDSVANGLPAVDLERLSRYIDYSAQRDIGFNYTLNTSFAGNREFTPEGIEEVLTLLGQLVKAGVRSLTIAMPSLMEVVRHSGYTFNIKASTICHITNVHKALVLKEAGVKRIVADESIHRNFKALTAIRNNFGPGVELIVNTICHQGCLYRHFHYNQVGGSDLPARGCVAPDADRGASRLGDAYFEHRCLQQWYQSPGEVLKLGWIRPEDLKHYTAAGINYFKLQGRRRLAKGNLQKTLECYFKESFDGNLLELLD